MRAETWKQADIVATAVVAVAVGVGAAVGTPAAVVVLPAIALLVAPGYIWGRILVPAKVRGLERLTVSIGLALALPVIGGLLLQLARVPLHAPGWAGLLAGVTLAGDVVLLRRRQSGKDTGPALRVPARDWWRTHLSGPGRAWQATAFGAAVVVAAAGVGLAALGAARQHYQGFTQLWLVPGRTGTASLGVSNHQGTAARYRLVLRQGKRRAAAWNLTLADGQSWQRQVILSARRTTVADLYRLPDLTYPYRYVAAVGGKVPGA